MGLGGWARHSRIHAGCSDMQVDMRSMAAVLHAWGLSFQQISNCQLGVTKFSRYKYSADKLLKAVRLALRLRGGPVALEDTIARSLALALPLYLQGSFLRDHNDSLRLRLHDSLVPSRSMVQRSELALDVAILLLVRSMFSAQSYRFALSDSSPLGGHCLNRTCTGWDDIRFNCLKGFALRGSVIELSGLVVRWPMGG